MSVRTVNFPTSTCSACADGDADPKHAVDAQAIQEHAVDRPAFHAVLFDAVSGDRELGSLDAAVVQGLGDKQLLWVDC